MKNKLRAAGFCCMFFAFFAAPAFADDQTDACGPYFDLVRAQDAKSIPQAYPQDLTIPTDEAVSCFSKVVASFNSKVQSVEDVEQPEILANLLSASAGWRVVMNRFEKEKSIRDFIKASASRADLSAVSVLTFAGRSSNRDLRLNATLILGNTIDNATACVPIIQLGDPKFMERVDAETAKKALNNIIGVTSVVAPWTEKDNAEAVERMLKHLDTLSLQSKETINISTVAENLRKRLAAKPVTDRQPLNPQAKQACDAYAGSFYARFATPPELQFWQVSLP